MCPLQENCPFFNKFGHIKHERLQQLVTGFCMHETGYQKCIHYQTHALFDMKLDENISPTCIIIPRPQAQQP